MDEQGLCCRPRGWGVVGSDSGPGPGPHPRRALSRACHSPPTTQQAEPKARPCPMAGPLRVCLLAGRMGTTVGVPGAGKDVCECALRS